MILRYRVLPWGHADGTVQPDHLTIQHRIVNDMTDQFAILSRIA